MLQITRFSAGSFPIKYLGTPLVYGKAKVCHFSPLIERIANFLKSWNTHSLFYAGRLELLKTVIQGVESFWLQTFPIPSTVIDNISKLCRNFLWAGAKPKWHGLIYAFQKMRVGWACVIAGSGIKPYYLKLYGTFML